MAKKDSTQEVNITSCNVSTLRRVRVNGESKAAPRGRGGTAAHPNGRRWTPQEGKQHHSKGKKAHHPLEGCRQHHQKGDHNQGGDRKISSTRRLERNKIQRVRDVKLDHKRKQDRTSNNMMRKQHLPKEREAEREAEKTLLQCAKKAQNFHLTTVERTVGRYHRTRP